MCIFMNIDIFISFYLYIGEEYWSSDQCIKPNNEPKPTAIDVEDNEYVPPKEVMEE